MAVSIRASTREATSQHAVGSLPATVSIRASTREATVVHFHCVSSLMFQSAPPRGRRRGAPGRRRLRCRFNPRLHAGGDLKVAGLGAYEWAVSIRASTREATVETGGGGGLLAVSIRASTREATSCGSEPRRDRGVSIRASTREATRSPRCDDSATRVSIRASTREATTPASHAATPPAFQSAPPRGRRP